MRSDRIRIAQQTGSIANDKAGDAISGFSLFLLFNLLCQTTRFSFFFALLKLSFYPMFRVRNDNKHIFPSPGACLCASSTRHAWIGAGSLCMSENFVSPVQEWITNL
jgi:hypothetical protein